MFSLIKMNMYLIQILLYCFCAVTDLFKIFLMTLMSHICGNKKTSFKAFAISEHYRKLFVMPGTEVFCAVRLTVNCFG